MNIIEYVFFSLAIKVVVTSCILIYKNRAYLRRVK
jgi:hypothetical protein